MDRDRLLQRAELLRQQRRLKDAENEVGVVLQSNPEDVDALVILGHCKIDGHLYAEAITILKQCLSYESNKDYVFYLLSFAYYHNNDNVSALSFLNEAIALFPFNPGYFALAAHIHLENRNPEKALELADTGLMIDAENVACLNVRSTVLFKLNKKKEAFETINEALSIDPENYSTHAIYGWHYLEKGKHKLAEKHFRESLRLNPEYAYAKQGYKSALKSKFIFYRWLLQSNIWMAKKDKRLRMGLLLGLWLLVSILNSTSINNTFVTIIIAIYVLLVIFSWLGSSLANLYLLATPHGNYILSHTEKWSARMVGICLLIAFPLFVRFYFFNVDYLFVPAVIAGLAISFNEIDFPIKPFMVKGRELYNHIILTTGMLSCLISLVNVTISYGFAMTFALLLVGYIWTGALRNKLL